QRGQPRVQDGNFDLVPRIDIGAFEVAPLSALDTVYVDDDWAGVPFGADPDQGGPRQAIGYDAFARITDAVNRVADNGTVIVNAGTYTDESVVVNRKVRVTA